MKKLIPALIVLALSMTFVCAAQNPDTPITIEELPQPTTETVGGNSRSPYRQQSLKTGETTSMTAAERQHAQQSAVEQRNAEKTEHQHIREKFQWGFIAGFVWSSNGWLLEQGNSRYNQAEFISGRPGFTVGGLGEVRISRTDGFEFGVKLTRSGFIYEERSAEGDLVIKCSRYTIDIPLNYKYYWGATQKWYWSLGLTPSIYVAGNGMWSDQYTPNLSLNPDSVYSRFNLGASMGIGYGIINVFFESNMTNTWSKEFINLIDGMTGYKTTAHRYIGAGIAINLKF